MTSENSSDSFNVDEEEDSIPNNHFRNSFSDDENSFLLSGKLNRDINIHEESPKKNIFSIDNILGIDNNTKNIKHNESEKYFIRPIPLIAASQENSAFKKREKLFGDHQGLQNLHTSNSVAPTPSSISNQNGGFLYANWIELQKSNMGNQGNFIFGYHGKFNYF